MLSFINGAKISELNNVFSNKSNTRISRKNAKYRVEIEYALFTSMGIPNQIFKCQNLKVKKI